MKYSVNVLVKLYIRTLLPGKKKKEGVIHNDNIEIFKSYGTNLKQILIRG